MYKLQKEIVEVVQENISEEDRDQTNTVSQSFAVEVVDEISGVEKDQTNKENHSFDLDTVTDQNQQESPRKNSTD